MHPNELQQLAEQLLAGQVSHERFVRAVTSAQMAALSEATLDLDRQRRCGFPEVVFGEGKSVEQLEQIMHRLLESGVEVLATRVSPDQAQSLRPTFPASRYNEVGRTFRISTAPPGTEKPAPRRGGHVAIVTAGTSDVPVAEEARETLDWMGVQVTMIHDVGVAGPHRLPAHLDKLENVDAVVVVAGMEGALPSVVGGFVACPVIAVPTSVGYGASFHGVAALLGMLNSCAANVTVVNIDAGFKAAYVAGLMAQRRGVGGVGSRE
jgi:NCAIR mutase (PurE)-related protein